MALCAAVGIFSSFFVPVILFNGLSLTPSTPPSLHSPSGFFSWESFFIWFMTCFLSVVRGREVKASHLSSLTLTTSQTRDSFQISERKEPQITIEIAAVNSAFPHTFYLNVRQWQVAGFTYWPSKVWVINLIKNLTLWVIPLVHGMLSKVSLCFYYQT